MLDINELQNDIKYFNQSVYWDDTTGISKKRCNLLEAVIKVHEYASCITQESLVELIRICNICMNSYHDCSTGYYKQWTHYREKFTALLDRETLMYVDGITLPERVMTAILCYTKIITEDELKGMFMLRPLFRTALYRYINKTYSIGGVTKPIVNINNKNFKVSMGERKVPVKLVLGC